MAMTKQRGCYCDIRGNQWWIGRRKQKDFGSCDCSKSEISIKDNITEREFLHTLIHEMLHASLADVSEEAVEETEQSIAGFLWACGYRRVKL